MEALSVRLDLIVSPFPLSDIRQGSPVPSGDPAFLSINLFLPDRQLIRHDIQLGTVINSQVTGPLGGLDILVPHPRSQIVQANSFMDAVSTRNVA
jgi:hypothetical protein